MTDCLPLLHTSGLENLILVIQTLLIFNKINFPQTGHLMEGCVLNLTQNTFNTLKKGVCKMNKYQERSVYTSIVALAFFLVLSLITHHWGFFFWSLLPVFMVLMTAFYTKWDKQNNGR